MDVAPVSQVFQEDFMQRITGFNFGGGNWIAISMIGAVNAFVNVLLQVDFVDTDGGTPGLKLFDGTGVGHGEAAYLRAGFPPDTLVRKEDFKGELRTNAGHALTGFGAFDARPFAIPATIVYVKIDKHLPASKFRLRCAVTFPSDDTGPSTTDKMIVSTIKGKSMKAGFNVFAPPSAFSARAPAPNHGATRDFVVHNDTLKIDGPI